MCNRSNRNFMIKTIFSFLIVICFYCSGSSATATSLDNYVFLGNHNIPPIIFIQDGKPTGLVVDIAKTLAQKSKLDIEVKAIDWGDAQAMVMEGKADALLQINKNKERETLYDFSEPLLQSSFSIFRKNSRTDLVNIKSLFGHTVGVEADGYPIALMKKYPEIKVLKIPDWKTGFDLVNSGEIEAVVVDRWVGEYVLAANSIQEIKILNEPLETSQSYIAVKKGNRELLDRINDGLKKMREDGSMNRILNQWSKQEVVYLPKRTVYYYKLSISLFLVSLFLLFAIIGIIFLGNRKLRKEVFKRNQAENQIRQYSETLEATVALRTKELRASEESFKAMVETLPVAIYSSVGVEELCQYVNPAFVRLFGYSSQEVPTVKHWWPLAYPDEIYRSQISGEWMTRVNQALKTQTAIDPMETEVTCKDGSKKTISWGYITVGEKNYACGIDLTDRKRAEDEKAKLEIVRLQLQKSESLSRMAGGIAHHFNNQLGAVIGNLEMALEDMPPDVGVTRFLLSAAEGAHNAVAVSSLMLTYLGQTTGTHVPMDLSAVCRQSLPLLRVATPKSINFKVDLPTPGPTICANAPQIQQILTNLIVNASEAIGKNQGTISLTVKTASSMNIPAAHRFPVAWQPQDVTYACLEVIDTGCGIAEEEIDTIFDPFFSSKFIGHSHGLGLAVVAGIVKTYGGVVTVESEQGRGSTFQVFLQVSGKESFLQTDTDVQPLNNEESTTVLLVEDEEVIRNMAETMLTRLGFKVLSAKDGVEAVEIFRQRMDEIHVVLSDLSMPRMDGWETLSALRRIRPKIPAVLVSGHDEATIIADEHSGLPHVFLHKPYKKVELKNALARALKRD